MSLSTEKISVPNPFPGLRPFKMEESHLFFGREGQSDEVLLKLSKNRFVGIIGPSGAGKSSFIYCGVLPILYGGFLTDASPDWEVVVTRPGSSPLENLAESLLKNTPDYTRASAEDQKTKHTIYSALLHGSSLGLVEAIGQNRPSKNVNYLILVDQFEELFRFKDSHEENSLNETLAFVNLLIEASRYPDAPIYVAITMRSDFIGDCAQFPELTKKINDSHYLIPQLTRNQKRKAIEGPVAVGNAQIAPRLIQQLLNDLGDNPDQLPILQHALMRTWSYWSEHRESLQEPIDLKHYEAIGTMAEALSIHANEAYEELTEDQKHLCETLFKSITEKRGGNFGIRRPTRLSEIASIANCREAELIGIIEKFRETGRSLLTPSQGMPIVSRSIIDISHESLMRIWVRLKNWVNDEADAVQMYTRLAEAAAMYQVGKAGLWRPPDLQLALNWQAKHKPTLVWGQRYHPAFERTMIFLEYSKKEWETEQRIKELEQKRKLKRARIIALVLGSATVISLLFLTYAIYQKTEADRNFELAEKQRIEAVAARNAAEEQRKKAEEAREAALLAQEKEAEQRKLADAARLDAEEKRIRAEAAEKEATSQRDRANTNAELAKKNELIAKANEEAAIKAQKESMRQRYIAQAKAMAVKSKELNDVQQEALIAQQAYNFNTAHKGYMFDNDIYNGLYTALKKMEHPLTMSLAGHIQGAARALVTHQSSNLIFSGGSDGKIIRWSEQQGQWKGDVLVENGPSYQVYSIAVSPDGQMLAAAGLSPANEKNNYIFLHNLNNIGSPKKITGFTYAVENITFTPDGKGIYARDNSGYTIKYSDLNTSKTVITSPIKINSIALSEDGKLLAGAGDNGSLYIWDIAKDYTATEIKNMGEHLTAVSFGPKGRIVVSGDNNGVVNIYDLSSQLLVRTLSGHTSNIVQIKFNHEGSFMATASKDKTVRLWNMNMLKEQPIVLSDHQDWVWSVTFTPNDEQLLASTHSTVELVKRKEFTIHAWPTKIPTMAGILCGKVSRNLNDEEWDIFVGEDLDYERTCENHSSNSKRKP